MEKKCVICGSVTSNSGSICSSCVAIDCMNTIARENKKPMKMIITKKRGKIVYSLRA